MAGIAAAELWEAIEEGKLTGDPAFDACVYSSSATKIF